MPSAFSRIFSDNAASSLRSFSKEEHLLGDGLPNCNKMFPTIVELFIVLLSRYVEGIAICAFISLVGGETYSSPVEDYEPLD